MALTIKNNKIIHDIFNLYISNESKLLKYGFTKEKDAYCYQLDIVEDLFTLYIWIYSEGEILTKLIENETKEEYILHLVDSAQGQFVGLVREAYVKALSDICKECFELNVFSGQQVERIIFYIKEKYHDELEFLWKNSESAIWRRKDNKKWYGLLTNITEDKLGLDSTEKVTILNLRISSEDLEHILDNNKYFKAYHMNKKHWVSLRINQLSFLEILKRVEASYELAK